MVGGVDTGTVSSWDRNSTDGHFDYSRSVWCSAVPKVLEDRKNPKMWALWFREFLKTIFPEIKQIVPCASLSHIVRLTPRCRSGTAHVREWKMKNWIQTLRHTDGL